MMPKVPPSKIPYVKRDFLEVLEERYHKIAENNSLL